MAGSGLDVSYQASTPKNYSFSALQAYGTIW